MSNNADIRSQFPLLNQQVNGHKLVYLDNAATTQKPQSVIDALSGYYTLLNSNIHRGTHHLASLATTQYEAVRAKMQRFLNASSTSEIIFTRGTTESINLVASSFSACRLHEGDEVIVSEMEHHSNIVPWQLACMRHKATLKVIPFNDAGELDLEAYDKLFSSRTRIVAVNHVSNTLGTVNPIDRLTQIAHSHGVPILIDGAQAVAHIPVDVQATDCDFYCLSGHKMYGPMGVGILYGKEELLNEMPPYQGGGEMIKEVTFAHTTFNELPFKFEAGTPSVGDVIALGKAIDFLLDVGFHTISSIEHQLTTYAMQRLMTIDGMRLIGTAENKTSVVSFLVGNAHPYDVGTLIDKLGVAVRTGHHCTQPIMNHYSIPGTVRASFAIYNTTEEVDALVDALNRILPMLL